MPASLLPLADRHFAARTRSPSALAASTPARRDDGPARWARPLGRLLLIAAAIAVPASAQAWWNADFSQRTRVTLNTSAAGVTTREALSGVTVPIRLHSGNFDFLGAAADGSDLRVVAGDDKTPLKAHVERFDGVNQLAVLWVQLPVVAPGTDKNEVFVYAGNPKAAAESLPAPAYDSATLAAITFGDKDAAAVDATGTLKATAPVVPEPNALIGTGAKLTGTPVAWPATDRVSAKAGDPYTVSLWVRSDNLTGTAFAQGALRLSLDAGKVTARLGTAQVTGGTVPPSAWAHLAAVAGGGKLLLYVDGQPAGEAALPNPAPAIEGGIEVGAGLTGAVDQLLVMAAARGADWIAFTRAVQGGDAKLVASKGEGAEEKDSGGHGGYMGVLVNNLTVDAWVVIIILAVMFVVAAWVMVAKSLLVGRAARANRGFLDGFRASKDVLAVAGAAEHPHSTLARLYEAGVGELRKRDIAVGGPTLSAASLDAVKATIDADLVRENQRLNAQMVLLTIAISGGPFLGLLGTVVGVMITFAAIAAAGDVNVNAIAPGIAAALLATVAGLAVAIPALFGYNYLATRIKNISSDMQVFVDEFVSRVAETYGAR